MFFMDMGYGGLILFYFRGPSGFAGHTWVRMQLTSAQVYGKLVPVVTCSLTFPYLVCRKQAPELTFSLAFDVQDAESDRPCWQQQW